MSALHTQATEKRPATPDELKEGPPAGYDFCPFCDCVYPHEGAPNYQPCDDCRDDIEQELRHEAHKTMVDA